MNNRQKALMQRAIILLNDLAGYDIVLSRESKKALTYDGLEYGEAEVGTLVEDLSIEFNFSATDDLLPL